MDVKQKLNYETPELETLGAVEDLTQGNATGSNLDADFSDGTPRGDLTFS